MKKYFIFCLVFLVSVLRLDTHTFSNLSLEEQVRATDFAVLGEVVSYEYRIDPSERFWKRTYVTIKVQEDLMKNIENFATYQQVGDNVYIEIDHPGGVFDGLTTRISGHPQFFPGEVYVLHLWNRDARNIAVPVVGFSNGAYRVIPDNNGVARVYGFEGVYPVKGFISREVTDSPLEIMEIGTMAVDADFGETTQDGSPITLDAFLVQEKNMLSLLRGIDFEEGEE